MIGWYEKDTNFNIRLQKICVYMWKVNMRRMQLLRLMDFEWGRWDCYSLSRYFVIFEYTLEKTANLLIHFSQPKPVFLPKIYAGRTKTLFKVHVIHIFRYVLFNLSSKPLLVEIFFISCTLEECPDLSDKCNTCGRPGQAFSTWWC